MSFAENFLPEFAHEMQGTRKILELVTDELLPWQAHESLHTIQWVASHIVDTVSWAELTMKETSFDVAPPDGPAHESPLFASAAELVPTFDKNLATATELIGAASDEDFAVPWTLKQGGNDLFTMPRAAIVKTFFLNHIIHHRAFLIAYLRMNGVECPGMYD